MEKILDVDTEAVVTIAALTSGPRLGAIAEHARVLESRGAGPALLREAAYVASLFCGFPRGVAALVELDKLSHGDRYRDAAPASRAEARARGVQVFRAIHLGNADRQLAMLEQAHPDYADTVLSEAYGRVLARTLLPLALRELVGVACLTVEGLPRQLRAHLLGARNVGVSVATLRASVALAAELGEVDPASAMEQVAQILDGPTSTAPRR